MTVDFSEKFANTHKISNFKLFCLLLSFSTTLKLTFACCEQLHSLSKVSLINFESQSTLLTTILINLQYRNFLLTSHHHHHPDDLHKALLRTKLYISSIHVHIPWCRSFQFVSFPPFSHSPQSLLLKMRKFSLFCWKTTQKVLFSQHPYGNCCIHVDYQQIINMNTYNV